MARTTSIVGIIPARFASTRFPGKPLHLLSGKPMIQHVWERCLKAKRLDQVIIATDDMRIAEAAFEFGAEISITSPKHPSGTDRIAEVASKIPGATHVLNIQGDEPQVEPRLIDRLADALIASDKPGMVTAAFEIPTEEESANPNLVKVVTGVDGYALYFSRHAIPFNRDGGSTLKRYGHMGIYGYSRKVLLDFVKWKPTPLEKTEKLEQLRALEHGVRIKVLKATRPSLGIDTPEDAAEFEAILAAKKR